MDTNHTTQDGPYTFRESVLVHGSYQIQKNDGKAIGVLRELSDAAMLTRHLNDAAKAPQWISVEERLPIKEKWVLVVADGAMNCAWYDRSKGWHNGFGERPKNIIIEEITHWMPLPAPPAKG